LQLLVIGNAGLALFGLGSDALKAPTLDQVPAGQLCAFAPDNQNLPASHKVFLPSPQVKPASQLTRAAPECGVQHSLFVPHSLNEQ
jgi:PAB1-binding protein PBP1